MISVVLTVPGKAEAVFDGLAEDEYEHLYRCVLEASAAAPMVCDTIEVSVQENLTETLHTATPWPQMKQGAVLGVPGLDPKVQAKQRE